METPSERHFWYSSHSLVKKNGTLIGLHYYGAQGKTMGVPPFLLRAPALSVLLLSSATVLL